MKNGAQIGASKNGKTYDYDQEYAKKAAEAFGDLLSPGKLVRHNMHWQSLSTQTSTIMRNLLMPNSCFSDIFYTKKQNWKMPGTVEAIFRGPSPDFRWL